MKKILTLALATLALTAGAQSKYTVKGHLNGVPDGTQVQLKEVAHEPMDPLATGTVNEGEFIIEGEWDEPVAVSLSLGDKIVDEDTRFILEPSIVTEVSGDFKEIERYGRPMYVVENYTVKGGELTDKYREELGIIDVFNKRYEADLEKHHEVLGKYSSARQEGDEEAMKAITESEAYKAYEADTQLFFNDVETAFHDAIVRNKDTFMGPLLMISLMSYFDEAQRAWYEEFPEDVRESRYGKRVLDELYPAGKVGSALPDFTLIDKDGNSVNLYEYCANNKYTLLDFWASWCRPCRAEIPNLKKIYNQWAERGFNVLSVSTDQEDEAWRKALEQTKMPWTQVRDADKVASKLYKVRAIPCMFIIDSEGRLVGDNLRGEELAEKIAELLGE